jgi:hypothetical protein
LLKLHCLTKEKVASATFFVSVGSCLINTQRRYSLKDRQMKFYGHANLQQNEIQNAALQTLTTFPTSPVVGQLAFVNSIVFICVGSDALPVWVPLTREITAYTHTEAVAQQVWGITHNLNTTSVNVQVFDGAGKAIIPDDIEITGPSSATITFTAAQAGKAVLVSGHFDGNVKPTYSYTHYEGTASTVWVILHNLGYNPIVRVFIGNQEVQPSAITHDSPNQTTISFTTAQVGYARLI